MKTKKRGKTLQNVPTSIFGRKPGVGERPYERSGGVIQRCTKGYKESLSKSEMVRLDTTTSSVTS